LHREKRNFMRIPVYMLLFLLLGLIFGYFTFKVLSFSRTVEVPDLSGKTLIEATQLLSRNGLYLKIEGENYDPVGLTGCIIKQDVPAGNKVKERRIIKVIISKGPKVRMIPMLINEPLLNVESQLLQKGLKIAKVIKVHSDTFEKGKIIAQKPSPDEQISDQIAVLVSLGPYEKIYYCPDFRDMSLAQGTELAKKLNLQVAVEGKGETIDAQKPDPGKQIKTGDVIHLKVSENIFHLW
jgi:beta-lactam-binding protein with PASTA domain